MGNLQRVSGILGAIGLCVGISFGSGGSNTLDCTKINDALCAELGEVTSDTTKIQILIALFIPDRDTTCTSVEVRPDTSSCQYNWHDSSYVRRLREAKIDMFNTYELWDSENPSQRLQAPENHERVFLNILATKATILGLRAEEYVTVIERDYNEGPAIIRVSKTMGRTPKGGNGETFLINGQRQGKNSARTPKLIRPTN